MTTKGTEAHTARRRGLGWVVIIGALVVYLVASAVLVLDTRRDVAAEETLRIDAVVKAVVLGCGERNEFRAAIVALAERGGTSVITPEIVDSVRDPELRRLLEAISANTESGRMEFDADLEALRAPEDCDEIARDAAER